MQAHSPGHCDAPAQRVPQRERFGLKNACRIMESGTHRTPWRTVFRARATVAQMAAVKPTTLKLGSKPEATTTPSTTGMSAAYTDGASRLPMTIAAIAAVKNGVVDPIACATRRYSRMFAVCVPPLAHPSECVQHQQQCSSAAVVASIVLLHPKAKS